MWKIKPCISVSCESNVSQKFYETIEQICKYRQQGHSLINFLKCLEYIVIKVFVRSFKFQQR